MKYLKLLVLSMITIPTIGINAQFILPEDNPRNTTMESVEIDQSHKHQEQIQQIMRIELIQTINMDRSISLTSNTDISDLAEKMKETIVDFEFKEKEYCERVKENPVITSCKKLEKNVFQTKSVIKNAFQIEKLEDENKFKFTKSDQSKNISDQDKSILKLSKSTLKMIFPGKILSANTGKVQDNTIFFDDIIESDKLTNVVFQFINTKNDESPLKFATPEKKAVETPTPKTIKKTLTEAQKNNVRKALKNSARPALKKPTFKKIVRKNSYQPELIIGRISQRATELQKNRTPEILQNFFQKAAFKK